MRIVLKGAPRTKKNSQRIVMMGGHPSIMPSAVYKQYEKDCLKQLTGEMRQLICDRVNVCCVYYMPTRRRVDLVNLIEATCDILVRGGVLCDDNSGVVAAHDGSRVAYDREDPRTEIVITAMD